MDIKLRLFGSCVAVDGKAGRTGASARADQREMYRILIAYKSDDSSVRPGPGPGPFLQSGPLLALNREHIARG